MKTYHRLPESGQRGRRALLIVLIYACLLTIGWQVGVLLGWE